VFGYHDIHLWYSTDKGVTWTEDTTAKQGMYFVTNPAIYAIGDKIWMTASTTEAGNADMRIWWGTFNAGRTSISWGGEQGGLWGPTADYIYNGGLVVHAEGSGYKAHFISTERWYDDCRYWRCTMDSSGAFVSTDVVDPWSSSGVEGTSYSNILLDPVTKDIFLIHEENGSGPDLKFQKRAYTSGTWPAGTVRVLYSFSYYVNQFSSAFDGDRVVIAAGDGTVNADTPIIVERDKADTTTTVRTPPSGIAGSIGAAQTVVAIQTDASKNILLVWNDQGTDITDFYQNTYTRGTNSWSGATLVRDTAPNTNAYYAQFIPGTKYFFFYGQDGGNYRSYMLDDMTDVAYTAASTLQSVFTMTATPTFIIAGGTSIPRAFVEIAFTTNPTDESPIWTDVTEDCSHIAIRRGRNRELDVIEPGKATFTFDNDDRQFDPENSAGPYYPYILPVRRIRVRAIWNNQIYDVFSGYASGWPQEYPDKHRKTVDLEAVDALGFLSFGDLTLSRSTELSGSRVAGVLNSVSWPSSERDIDVGQETLITISDEQTNALDALQEIAATELGRLFAAKDGKITFHGRDRIVGANQPASSGTWSDDPGDKLYDDIVPSQDEGEIRNRITITRRDGLPQVAEDAVSKAAYFLRDYTQSDVPILTDADSLARAQFLLSQYKDPHLRFSSMVVDPRADDQWPAALNLEIGDHIVAERFVADPPMISKDVFVDGINHDINRDDKSWLISYALTPMSEVSDWWIVGESILGVDTRLAF